jgi:hypothetical protein
MLYIAVICIASSVAFYSCSNSDGNGTTGGSAVSAWTISGTIDFGGALTHDVKLAGFYIPNGGELGPDGVVVSNIIDLGTTSNASFPFTLNIDVTSQSPSLGDVIVLIFWQENLFDNNVLDYIDVSTFEWTTMAIPVSGCPVFEDAVACKTDYFDFDDPANNIINGWNIHTAFAVGYNPITSTNNNFSGATIAEMTSLLWE